LKEIVSWNLPCHPLHKKVRKEKATITCGLSLLSG